MVRCVNRDEKIKAREEEDVKANETVMGLQGGGVGAGLGVGGGICPGDNNTDYLLGNQYK